MEGTSLQQVLPVEVHETGRGLVVPCHAHIVATSHQHDVVEEEVAQSQVEEEDQS